MVDGFTVSFSDGSLLMFSPELVIVATILLLLFVRLFNAERLFPAVNVALYGSVLALLLAVLQFFELKSFEEPVSQEFFTGLLVYDKFTVFFRQFLLLSLILTIYLTVPRAASPDKEDAPDFYVLLLGSTVVGMMLMASARIIFCSSSWGSEMASVPSYADGRIPS